MRKVTRRAFVTTAGAALLPAPGLRGYCPVAPAGSAVAAARCASSPYRFFDAAEARFIEAACERLIPADGSAPGARAAGVTGDIDAHLSGAWGAGERWYRDGPWQPGSASLPSPSRFTPAGLFRAALGAINHHLDTRGVAFDEWPARAQDEFLASLESGEAHLGVPTAMFFQLLLSLTVEAFFSNPTHGGSRDRIGWRMAVFPGAHARLA